MVLPQSYNSYLEYFSSCCDFLKKHEWIFNFPVTEIFVQDVTSCIPQSWVNPLSNLSDDEMSSFPVYLVKESWPESLVGFCRWSKRLKLEPSTFNHSKKLESSQLIKAGLTPKKIHEVHYLVPFIDSLCVEQNIDKIVDIGSGLGYLDLFLYLNYNYKILGIEYGKKLVETAKLSYEKLKAALPSDHGGSIKYVENHVSPETVNTLCDEMSRYFSENSERADLNLLNLLPLSNSVKVPVSEIGGSEKWKTCIGFEKEIGEKLSIVDPPESDAKKYPKAMEKSCKIGVVGLHTCGDLCIDSLNLFLRSDRCQMCVLLPCCYHKMSKQTPPPRKSISNAPNDKPLQDIFINFPLSFSLKTIVAESPSTSLFLQTPFLRLAANQTAHQWFCMSEEKRKSQLFHTLARAVIQLYLYRYRLLMKKRKRRCVRKVKTGDFNSYLTCFLSRCEISTNVGEILNMSPDLISRMNQLWEEMKPKQKLVQIVLCLQANIQFVAESLVITDRIKYLLENNVRRVDVVRVLDDSISPRALALYAQK